MPKLTAKKKNGKVIITSKLSFDEQKNDREIVLFSQDAVQVFFRPKVIHEKKILYFAPEGTQLKKYLRNPIDVDTFFLILVQVIGGIQRVESRRFSIKNLLLDTSYLYINEITKEVTLLYQPIISTKTSANPIALINELLYTTVFNADDDTNPVSELILFMRGVKDFSTDDFLQKIEKIYPRIRGRVPGQNSGQDALSTSSYEEYIKQRQNWQNHGETLQGNREEGTTVLSASGGTTKLNP